MPVAQWIEQQLPKLKVVGSSPVGHMYIYIYIILSYVKEVENYAAIIF